MSDAYWAVPSKLQMDLEYTKHFGKFEGMVGLARTNASRRRWSSSTANRGNRGIVCSLVLPAAWRGCVLLRSGESPTGVVVEVAAAGDQEGQGPVELRDGVFEVGAIPRLICWTSEVALSAGGRADLTALPASTFLHRSRSAVTCSRDTK